jgi:phosphoenolpyruvate synthase/pyruvate phosphate dikinase
VDARPVVVPGPDVVALPPETVGAKAANLGRLAEAGLPVPPFFVLAPAALERHLEEAGLAWPAGDAPAAAWAEVHRGILAAALPPAVSAALGEAYRALPPAAPAGEAAGSGGRVAVRSSAAAEDGAAASFAGQFTSVLAVSGAAALAGAVRAVWASALSAGSRSYRRAVGSPPVAAPGFAVIVQAQVVARRAGVLFTEHPLEPGSATAYLEANFGTGESVAGGLATPDALTLSRATGEVVAARLGSKRRMTVLLGEGTATVDTDPALQGKAVLEAGEARQILAAGLAAERLFGAPQDLEWAWDEARLWIVQSRPITGTPAPGAGPDRRPGSPAASRS